MDEANEVVGEDSGSAPDIDELVAQLRERVETRRRSGAYPADLEQQMTAHFQRILSLRADARPLPDLQAAMDAVREALPLQAARIPTDSGLPGGQTLHKAIAKVVSRQTQGTLQQVQAFAQPVQAALEALAAAIQELSRVVNSDVAQSLDGLYERQAEQERLIAGAARADGSGASFQPWYSSERFEEAFRGSREELLERYRDLAERLVGSGPVLDFGCGRGEFLELLARLGVEARGVDVDSELVEAAVKRGLHVEEGDGLQHLRTFDDKALGGLSLIQVVEHLSAQAVVDLVALAADKVRPGGRVFVETVNPQSLYVFAHSFFLDPTHLRPVHPAYLAFLFREAGFAAVDIEWRSLPPSDDILAPGPDDWPGAAVYNKNVRRLNELLYAAQDYLILATR